MRGVMRRVVLLSMLMGVAVTGPALALVPSEASPSPRDVAAETELPDYMRSWEFGIHAEDDAAPRFFADLIVPLYRPAPDRWAVFVEPRVSHANHETLVNLGLGYRRLAFQNAWMLGGNAFYDYDTEHAHYRIGSGFEAISAFAEFRTNAYFGLSPARTAEPGLSSNVVEETVDGFDLEAGFPVPHYSRLKLFGGYEWYNFKQFKNREGWSLRAEYRPLPFLVLDVVLTDNTKRATGVDVNLAFRLPLGGNAPSKATDPLRLDPAIFPDSDVSDRLMTLVERHHEIVVEGYTKANGQISIEVRRGT